MSFGNRRAKSVLLLLVTLFVLLVGSSSLHAQYPAKCDGDKSCVGNALTIQVTQGKGAQYVDIDTSYKMRALDSAITFEAWINPTPQPGKRQFIAGLWGPNKDNNDQWVLYIEDNELVFALSADASFKGDLDNTIVQALIPDLYTRGWVHVAAVWDGKTTQGRLIVDGQEVARTSNAQYPITHLHPIESKTLGMQLASCNGLYDDSSRFRAFLGQLDEVRLWNRALSQREVDCQRLLSLNGNEAGLIMYFRCNEPAASQFLCDAAGNMIGKMRSGAKCQASTRVIPLTYTVLPTSVTTSLACTSDTTFVFTITDTSFCGDKVNLGVNGASAGLFSLSTTSLLLTQNVPQQIVLSLRANQIGTLSAGLVIASANRCGTPLTIPITINRTTQLSYSTGSVKFDTLYVGCEETKFYEDTVKICNITGTPVNVTGASFDSNYFTWKPGGGYGGLPLTLQPGQCWVMLVRFDQLDSSKTLRDTLRIASNDKCPGSGVIPIYGRSQAVIALLATDGKRIVDTMAFEAVCPTQVSSVRLYQFRGLTVDTVFIDSITYSKPQFFGAFFRFPVKLAPKTAYQATYVRFKPTVPGPVVGEMKVYSHYHGCTIVKRIGLSGRGISVDFTFNQALLTYGNVTIGKTRQLTATVTNNGKDPRDLASYLKVGDVFTIIAGKSFTLQPGQTGTITVEFRPRELKNYVDTLAVFDEGCYSTIEIPITGTGVFQDLSFTPPFLPITDVIGCQCQTDTITAKNITGTDLTITTDVLIDPSGKMKLISPSHAGLFKAGSTIQYIVTYCPNDLALDRADDGYIDINLSNGEKYELLIRATSLAPKLYVSPLTTFQAVEVGWQKTDSVLLENNSSIPLHITGVNVPPGYTVLSTKPPLPYTLQPRDSLWVYVQFKPTASTSYNGPITVQTDQPCNLTYGGVLTGRGALVKLEVPLSFVNYSLIKPCDCLNRIIPLPNFSNFVPVTIDSIWIDGVGVPSPNPTVFKWSSSIAGTTAPYSIKPGTEDTLTISFCPNIPAIQANILLNASLHIAAHTPGWSQTFTTILSGRRELNFQPSKVLVNFPATRVDTSAQAVSVDIAVPDPFVNPSGDSVIIDWVSFQPDQKVFSVVASTGAPLPWIIHRGEKFSVKVNFFPRAPKTYIARMLLHTIFPCDGIDTSILVMGSGFAPAFGLQMAFDTAKIGRDTIVLNTCDTLTLPIMISRAIPQNIIDIIFRLGYDTTALRLLGIQSKYTPTATIKDSTDGAHADLKDARNVQAGIIAYVKFVVRGGAKRFPITLDSIFFDSDSLVFFKIVAGIDKGFIEIDQPKIAISSGTRFDTVNARSCDDRFVTVRNPGLIPIRFDSLGGLPKWHTVVASSIPYPAVLKPGDSIVLTVRFCPRAEATFDTSLFSVSSIPCPIVDSGSLHSFGYAPPFPFSLVIGGTVSTIDSVAGVISDTVFVPIMIDRDFPLSPIDMKYTLTYNRRALQYVSTTSKYSTPVVKEVGGGLSISLPKSQGVMKGEIARVKFVVAVPDSIVTKMILAPLAFTSDSDLWIKPVPNGDTTSVRVDPRCNISYLEFRGGINSISIPSPNPSNGRVKLNVEFVEDAYASLKVFSATGALVARPLDGSSLMKGGKYAVDLDLTGVAPGAYYIRFEAGNYHETRRMMIVR
jgi:hypothetical protein